MSGGKGVIREAEIVAWLAGHLAEREGTAPGAVAPETPFAMLGFDSIDAIVMAGSFEERFGTEPDPALFMRNGSLGELLAELRGRGLLVLEEAGAA